MQTAADQKPPPTSAEIAASNRIFTSGRQARNAGIAIKDCPFAKGSQARVEWESGWRSVGNETNVNLFV